MPDTRLRAAAAQAGIGPDDPLAPLLDALDQTAQRVRGLPDPAAEAAIAERVADGITERVEASLARRARTMEWRLFAYGGTAALGAVAIAFAAGWWAGAAQPVMTDLGPQQRQVVQMLRTNDMAAALDRCTPIPQNAGRACAVAIWLDPPPPAQQARR